MRQIALNNRPRETGRNARQWQAVEDHIDALAALRRNPGDDIEFTDDDTEFTDDEPMTLTEYRDALYDCIAEMHDDLDAATRQSARHRIAQRIAPLEIVYEALEYYADQDERQRAQLAAIHTLTQAATDIIEGN